MLRGERLERPFAHLYETGGMRRVHLRGHTNIRRISPLRRRVIARPGDVHISVRDVVFTTGC